MKYRFNAAELLHAISKNPEIIKTTVNRRTWEKAIGEKTLTLKPYLAICKALNLSPRVDSSTNNF